jgi:hypothetical protein
MAGFPGWTAQCEALARMSHAGGTQDEFSTVRYRVNKDQSGTGEGLYKLLLLAKANA